mmetsp:Transcript_1321/g.2763  ORF Transcript_1321/g.2763 Transcript_1321/m.2763 type:complete len:96 (+) Transcript_1321:50-337(+)|eukprot:3589637-Prymnesium_polylepis.2
MQAPNARRWRSPPAAPGSSHSDFLPLALPTVCGFCLCRATARALIEDCVCVCVFGNAVAHGETPVTPARLHCSLTRVEVRAAAAAVQHTTVVSQP